ncbi:MAG: hypothetical protein CV087_22030 [Candidatus Brocadia sp. WS118]|nr:MAG: hypothetical protein CV087_22030 [Candidatus Brocadia sp. WS118]
MTNNYFQRLRFINASVLLILFLSLPSTSVLSEEIYPNSETVELSDTPEVNIMEEISLLYHDLHVGTVGFKPSYQISEAFDDNIFNLPEDEKSDFYTLHKMDLGVESPIFEHARAYADYNAEIYDYERFEERDYDNHSLKGAVEFRFSNDFRFSFSDQIRKYVIPPGVQRRYYNDVDFVGIPIEDIGPLGFVERRDLIANMANFDLDIPDFFPNLDFSIHYENYDVSYQQEEFENSDFNTNTIDTTAEYQSPFLPIKISSGFLYQVRRYNTPVYDGIGKNIPFIINWQINSKNQVHLENNYRISTYGSKSDLEDFEGLGTILRYRYTFNPVSSVEISGERSVKEARAEDNNAFFYTAVGIKYILQHNRFSSSIEVNYSNYTFFEEIEALGKVEKINSVGVNFTIRYNPQEWWFAEFEYAYNRGDDTIDVGDLTKSIVSLGVGLNF